MPFCPGCRGWHLRFRQHERAGEINTHLESCHAHTHFRWNLPWAWSSWRISPYPRTHAHVRHVWELKENLLVCTGLTQSCRGLFNTGSWIESLSVIGAFRYLANDYYLTGSSSDQRSRPKGIARSITSTLAWSNMYGLPVRAQSPDEIFDYAIISRSYSAMANKHIRSSIVIY